MCIAVLASKKLLKAPKQMKQSVEPSPLSRQHQEEREQQEEPSLKVTDIKPNEDGSWRVRANLDEASLSRLKFLMSNRFGTSEVGDEDVKCQLRDSLRTIIDIIYGADKGTVEEVCQKLMELADERINDVDYRDISRELVEIRQAISRRTLAFSVMRGKLAEAELSMGAVQGSLEYLKRKLEVILACIEAKRAEYTEQVQRCQDLDTCITVRKQEAEAKRAELAVLDSEITKAKAAVSSKKPELDQHKENVKHHDKLVREQLSKISKLEREVRANEDRARELEAEAKATEAQVKANEAMVATRIQVATSLAAELEQKIKEADVTSTWLAEQSADLSRRMAELEEQCRRQDHRVSELHEIEEQARACLAKAEKQARACLAKAEEQARACSAKAEERIAELAKWIESTEEKKFQEQAKLLEEHNERLKKRSAHLQKVGAILKEEVELWSEWCAWRRNFKPSWMEQRTVLLEGSVPAYLDGKFRLVLAPAV